MLTIGALAKQYGCLPSQVRDHATVYDIMIYDVMMAWEKYQSRPGDMDNYHEDDLLKVVEAAR